MGNGPLILKSERTANEGDKVVFFHENTSIFTVALFPYISPSRSESAPPIVVSTMFPSFYSTLSSTSELTNGCAGSLEECDSDDGKDCCNGFVCLHIQRLRENNLDENKKICVKGDTSGANMARVKKLHASLSLGMFLHVSFRFIYELLL